MTGTLLNTAAIIIGGVLGMLLGNRIPERLKNTLVAGLGLFTLAYGINMFAKSQNVLVVLGAIIIGGLLGEWWQIEDALRRLGSWLETRLIGNNGEGGETRFVRGFLTTSLVVCIGPLAILGSIENGMTGNYSTLAIKSILDLIVAMAFASSLGIGVLFSAVALFAYQGGLSLAALQIHNAVNPTLMDLLINEMSATGGVILIGVAIGGLLEIRPIRSANFLPALAIAPLLALVFKHFGL